MTQLLEGVVSSTVSDWRDANNATLQAVARICHDAAQTACELGFAKARTTEARRSGQGCDKCLTAQHITAQHSANASLLHHWANCLCVLMSHTRGAA